MSNQFEAEISRSFRIQATGLPYPLSSPYEYIRLLVPSVRGNSFASEQPCDSLVDVYNKQGLALELKEIARRGALPFSRIPTHQIEGLQRFSILGRKSYLLVCFRVWTLTQKEKQGLKPLQLRALQERRAYALSIDDFLIEKHRAQASNRKSLSVEYIVSTGILLPPTRWFHPTTSNPKGFKTGWDITPLL